ncbi:hypothetical protein BDY21DRAFT_124827 [Lineolata rhizophorae]|uniref:Uncharacterized protein n=1 Tax=Lineolata rhizophorae TaxID=578093 RepID=A0A6A6NNY8_9PEZI|nr:hypothetical protein BDY21DRAFT_124827 [Lineolata rhizophorae]
MRARPVGPGSQSAARLGASHQRGGPFAMPTTNSGGRAGLFDYCGGAEWPSGTGWRRDTFFIKGLRGRRDREYTCVVHQGIPRNQIHSTQKRSLKTQRAQLSFQAKFAALLYNIFVYAHLLHSKEISDHQRIKKEPRCNHDRLRPIHGATDRQPTPRLRGRRGLRARKGRHHELRGWLGRVGRPRVAVAERSDNGNDGYDEHDRDGALRGRRPRYVGSGFTKED